jgi:hypothetical protein
MLQRYRTRFEEEEAVEVAGPPLLLLASLDMLSVQALSIFKG